MTVREKNIKKVVKCALESFIEIGIEGSTVTDIARQAQLTERSVFRYFETKQDLVLAAVLQYWEYLKGYVSSETDNIISDENILASEKIESVLKAYASIFFTNRKELIFIEEAEVYLYRAGKIDSLQEKRLLAGKGKTPLGDAIKKGILEGVIVEDEMLKVRYYNSFDALLGLLQKSAVLRGDNKEENEFIEERLRVFCRLLAYEFLK